MEEKLNFKELLEKYKKAKNEIKVDVIQAANKQLTAENKQLTLDINHKNKKLVNAHYAVAQNLKAINSMEEKMTEDPSFAAVVENADAILAPLQQKLSEANNYKEKLIKEIKEAEKKIDENKKKIDKNNKALKKPEEVYKEVVAEAETKTKTANDKLDKKIEKLEVERENYGIATKDKDGKSIKRITPEERIVIEDLTKQIKELEEQKEVNKSKLNSFMRLIGLMQDTNRTVNTEPANTEPTNTEPANTEPANTEPVNSEPANTEPANTELTNSEPANAESTRTKKLIEVKVSGKKYEFIYEDNGEILSENKEKIGFFKGLKERLNLWREGKFGYNRTAFKIDPTITQNLTKNEMKDYIAFIEQRGEDPAPFIVKYDKEKGIMAKAFAKSAKKLGLPEPLTTNRTVDEKFGENFRHDVDSREAIDRATSQEVKKTVRDILYGDIEQDK